MRSHGNLVALGAVGECVVRAAGSLQRGARGCVGGLFHRAFLDRRARPPLGEPHRDHLGRRSRPSRGLRAARALRAGDRRLLRRPLHPGSQRDPAVHHPAIGDRRDGGRGGAVGGSLPVGGERDLLGERRESAATYQGVPADRQDHPLRRVGPVYRLDPARQVALDLREWYRRHVGGAAPHLQRHDPIPGG